MTKYVSGPDEWAAHVEDTANRDGVRADTEHVRADGSTYPVEVSVAMVENQHSDYIVTIARDISRRKARVQQLERFRAYVEQSSDLITMIDEDGTIVYNNPAITDILGYENGDLVGESPFEYIHPEDRDRIIERWEDLLQTGGYLDPIEYRVQAADGSWVWLEAQGRNLLDNEFVDGVVVNQRDISGNKEREQELQRQNNRLHEFASIVSHDLRNPLNVAQGRLELARETDDLSHLDHVQQALERMDTLIEDILTAARDGDRVEVTEPVHLGEICEETWQMVSTENASLQNESDCVIEADSSRLMELLENLFRNAIEHAGSEVTITVGDLPGGFYVADNGPGIPKEDRDSVFDAGYTTADAGTGLGLNIVDRIAEAHHWDVTITESETGGARFEFRV